MIMAGLEDDKWQPGTRPGWRDAFLLIAAAAIASGLFYLWLGEVASALGYGVLTGIALAAIGAEFFKFVRSHRAENPAGSTAAAVQSLVAQSFRDGFATTFGMILRELVKLVGFKLLLSLVIAVSALFFASRHNLL